MSTNQVFPFALRISHNFPFIKKHSKTFIDKGTIKEIRKIVINSICYNIQKLNKCIEQINLEFDKSYNKLKSLEIQYNNSNTALKQIENTISKKINNINTLEEFREFYNSSEEKGWKAEVFIDEDWHDLSPTCEEVFEYYSVFDSNT
jgi:chromosome segregation ATPase